MTENELKGQEDKIKKFEERIVNRSVSFLLIYDSLANKILEWCRADIKPGTLSMLSFLPLALFGIFHPGCTTVGFIFGALSLLTHQVMDIANKKQAYRLDQFSLATFYIDHTYDALSVSLIVYIITTFLGFQTINIWLSIFLFGLLPFYIAHISMYQTGQMQFSLINPTSEGLLIFQLLFVLCILKNDLFQMDILSIKIYQIIVFSCSIWLFIIICKFIWDAYRVKKQIHGLFLKNIFVILTIGYLFLSNITLASRLLQNTVFFIFLLIFIMAHFSMVIGNLMMSYGCSTKYNQITINTVLVTSSIIFISGLCYLFSFEKGQQAIIGNVLIGIFCVLQVLYLIWYHRKNLRYINQMLT